MLLDGCLLVKERPNDTSDRYIYIFYKYEEIIKYIYTYYIIYRCYILCVRSVSRRESAIASEKREDDIEKLLVATFGVGVVAIGHLLYFMQ